MRANPPAIRILRTLLCAPVALAAVALFMSLTGCAPTKPLATAPYVDLDRFMGDWYVQGHIPAGAEEAAYNAVESYALEGETKVLTSYVFRKGGFDGKLKTLEPTGFVSDRETNATWGMRFIWPFKAEYLVGYVDAEYTETIIARSKRDYVWIMTREPEISPARYDALVERVRAMEYDVVELRRVPQRWPDEDHPVGQAGGNLARFTQK